MVYRFPPGSPLPSHVRRRAARRTSDAPRFGALKAHNLAHCGRKCYNGKLARLPSSPASRATGNETSVLVVVEGDRVVTGSLSPHPRWPTTQVPGRPVQRQAGPGRSVVRREAVIFVRWRGDVAGTLVTGSDSRRSTSHPNRGASRRPEAVVHVPELRNAEIAPTTARGERDGPAADDGQSRRSRDLGRAGMSRPLEERGI